MKYLTTFATIVLLASPAMASQPYGIWKTQTDKSGAYLLVEVLDCANDRSKLCAEIREVINSENREIVGKPIFWSLESAKAGNWVNGEVWDVENDKIYAGKVTMGESQLRVEGCVSIFCDGQNWSRAD